MLYNRSLDQIPFSLRWGRLGKGLGKFPSFKKIKTESYEFLLVYAKLCYEPNLCFVLNIIVIHRLLDSSRMQQEQLVVSDLRKCMELSIQIYSEFPLEQRREMFANGSHDLKSGPT